MTPEQLAKLYVVEVPKDANDFSVEPAGHWTSLRPVEQLEYSHTEPHHTGYIILPVNGRYRFLTTTDDLRRARDTSRASIKLSEDLEGLDSVSAFLESRNLNPEPNYALLEILES